MLLYRMNLMEDQPFELPYIQTHNLITAASSSPSKNYSSTKHPRPLVLVIIVSDQQISEDAKLITSVVQSLRISVYPMLPHLIYTQLHQLIRSKSFQLVIFEDILMYFKLPASIRTALDEYCKANNVNIIAFPKNLNTLKSLSNDENFSEVRLSDCV